MSLRFVNQQGEPIVLRDMGEFFDPRLNDVFSWGIPFTVSRLVQIYNALFSRQNVLDNPRIFYLSHNIYALERAGVSVPAFTNQIFDALGDDNAWMLPWLQFTITEHGLRLIWYTPYGLRLTHGEVSFDYNDHTAVTRTTTPSIVGQVSAAIREFVTAWKQLLEYPDAHYNIHYFNGLSYLTSQIASYILNGRVFRNHAGNSSLTPSEVLSLLQSDATTELMVTERDDDKYYLRVVTPISRNYRTPLYTTLNYSTNVLDYIPKNFKANNENNPTLYGVELEMSTDYREKDIVDAAEEPFFILKSDGSITGSKTFRYELVTSPASLKAHKKNFAHLFSALDYDHFDTSNETNNGMHVHIDRRAFQDPRHLRSFTWFITNPANRQFIIALSERKNDQNFARYAPFPEYRGRSTATFPSCVSLSSGIRGAINFGKRHTVEVRFFKGIVSYASVIKNLEAVDAIMNFSLSKSLQDNTLENFLAFLEKTPKNRYQVLKSFMKGQDTDQLVRAAKIVALVHPETRPDKVKEIITKAKVNMDSDIVTTLNQLYGNRRTTPMGFERRERTFVLNRVTGELTIAKHNQGKLAYMDRELEKKYARSPAAPVQPSVTPPPVQNSEWRSIPVDEMLILEHDLTNSAA